MVPGSRNLVLRPDTSYTSVPRNEVIYELVAKTVRVVILVTYMFGT
jgi:hypothetical protein